MFGIGNRLNGLRAKLVIDKIGFGFSKRGVFYIFLGKVGLC